MSKEAFTKGIMKMSDSLQKNSPFILMAVGLIGGLTAFGMGCKAAVRTKMELDKMYESLECDPGEELTTKEIAIKEIKVAAPIFAPSLLLLATSGACIVGSYHINVKRTAAVATAYTVTKTAFDEYRRKVIETIGENKNTKIEDAIYKERVNANPPEDNDIFQTGTGDTLCYDSISSRYFRCNRDLIRKVENNLNKRLTSGCERYISLNEFYYELGLPRLGGGVGDDIGWNADTEIDIRFSSALTETDVPVLVLDYAAAPRWDYRKLM